MSATNRKFRIEQVSWASTAAVLRAIRFEVFVIEQGVPEALEWDGLDSSCLHVLACDKEGVPIGTGRLLPDAHIGRMAVVKSWRRAGVGSAILAELLKIAGLRGDRIVILSAQSYALEFYRRAGFRVTSEEFLEAGILHRQMSLQLRAD